MRRLSSVLGRGGRVGLAFARSQGLVLQVLCRGGESPIWEKAVSFSDIESDRSCIKQELPITAGWVLIVPSYQCTVKYTVLPSTDTAEMEKMLAFDLPNIVPFNARQWVWDFSILGRDENGSSKVIVVLSPLAVVAKYVRSLAMLGAQTRLVTVSSLFYAYLLSRKKDLPESAFGACVYLDDGQLDFFAVENFRVVFFRGVRVESSRKIADVLQTEVRRSLFLLSAQGLCTRIDRFVAISKDGSGDDFAELTENVVSGPVQKVDRNGLFSHFLSAASTLITETHDGRCPRPREKTTINLLPAHLKQKRDRRARNRKMLVHAFKVCVLLLLLLFCLKAVIWREGQQLRRYENRLAEISPVAEKLQSLHQQLEIIQKQLHGHVSTLDVIGELYKILPHDVSIHYLGVDRSKYIVIRAQAKLLSQAFDCIGPLEQSPYFRNVRQSYANQRQIENSVLIDFEIKADLEQADQPGGQI